MALATGALHSARGVEGRRGRISGGGEMGPRLGMKWEMWEGGVRVVVRGREMVRGGEEMEGRG